MADPEAPPSPPGTLLLVTLQERFLQRSHQQLAALLGDRLDIRPVSLNELTAAPPQPEETILYFAAGVRHLHGRRLEASIQLDDQPPVTTRLRTLLVGNCGRLPGGITLIPDALVDDGILDIAAIDTRGGIAGWAQLFGEVVLQGLGVKTVELPNRIGRIDHTQCRSVIARILGGEQAQVDGDIIGRASAIKAWVEPGALVVRSPRRITIAR